MSDTSETVVVSNVVPGEAVLSVSPALPSFVGIVESSDGGGGKFPPGTSVVLAGPPVHTHAWHVDRVLAHPSADPTSAARIVLRAHLLYLLRKSGIRPGEKIYIIGSENGRRILRPVVERYGLRPAGSGDAEVLVLLESLDQPVAADCRVLLLAGVIPEGLDVITGPAPVNDPRTYFAFGKPRWPMVRCLRAAQEFESMREGIG